MKLTDEEIARLKRDRIAAPDQPLRDSMVLCGINPDDFTEREIREIAEGVRQQPD